MRNQVFGTLWLGKTNQPDQLQKLARVMKCLIQQQQYYTIQAANNKDADQTAWMRSLISDFVVRAYGLR